MNQNKKEFACAISKLCAKRYRALLLDYNVEEDGGKVVDVSEDVLEQQIVHLEQGLGVDQKRPLHLHNKEAGESLEAQRCEHPFAKVERFGQLRRLESSQRELVLGAVSQQVVLGQITSCFSFSPRKHQ